MTPAVLYLSALWLGLAGSLHCVGMCGPLALALPGGGAWWPRRLAYHAGRITVYAAMGAVVGVAGHGLSAFLTQQWLSVTAGVLVLALLAFKYLVGDGTRFGRFNAALSRWWGRLARRPGVATFGALGGLNALLPCGLVYVALAGSLAGGGPASGAAFMAAFGLGTAPALFVTMAAGRKLAPGSWRKVAPALAVLAAGLLIVRGLNLGVPYLSPKLEANAVVRCH